MGVEEEVVIADGETPAGMVVGGTLVGMVEAGEGIIRRGRGVGEVVEGGRDRRLETQHQRERGSVEFVERKVG